MFKHEQALARVALLKEESESSPLAMHAEFAA